MVQKRGVVMAIVENRKMDKAVDELLSRQEYLVTQANDLAKSFGNLTVFEHKVLDFCFSFVQRDDVPTKEYSVKAKDILKHLGLNLSGFNYKRVAKAFKGLNEKTAIYMLVRDEGEQGILMTSLFSDIMLLKSGKIKFQFSPKVAPFVFQLKEHFYSFKLSELSRVRSKYTLSLMKLWNAKGSGPWKPEHNQLPDVRIEGDVQEWESWMLGSDDDGNPKKMSAGVFKRDVLNRALKELSNLYPKTMFTLTTIKNGVKVVGYQLDIHPINTNLNTI